MSHPQGIFSSHGLKNEGEPSCDYTKTLHGCDNDILHSISVSIRPKIINV